MTDAHTTPAGLRVGLVGYGGAGRGIHARLLREAGMTVHDVVVRDPGRRAAAAADWPGVGLHDSLDRMLDDATLDLVVVASPNGLHEDHAATLVAARVPIVLDKPIARTGDAAEAIVRAGQDASVPLTVFHNRRWDPEQLTLASVVPRLGRVHRFERRWERWRPEPQQRWKENDLEGGGLLLDLGPHLVDSATQLFGPVTSVYAELRALTTPTEDDVLLSLRHAPTGGDRTCADGVVSHLWAGSLVGAPGPRTRVLGDQGAFLVTTFEADASPLERLDEAAPDGHLGWIATGHDLEPVPRAPGEHADFYRDAARWLTAGGPPPVDPWDAVRTARVLDAARTSARTGARVAL